MSAVHSTVQLVAGDDWEIVVTMIDDNDQPYNLTGAEILWTLVDDGGQQFIQSDEVTVSIAAPPTSGKAKITVPSVVTSRLKAYVFHDATRIVVGGITTTVLTGAIQVLHDPFSVASRYQFTEVAA
jgi:hypothetical protein